MSGFVEKIGEKLHMGGQKKEDQHATGEPQAHAVGHAGEHVVAHPEHVESAGYGGQHGQEKPHGYGAAEIPAAHGVAAAPHHEGPLEKVKNKIKGPKKHEGHESSSSSSESDGEGGRRKKKHGPF